MPEWYIGVYGTYGVCMGILWRINGESMGNLWGVYGGPPDFQGISTRLLWHTRRMWLRARMYVICSGCARLQSHTYGDQSGIHIVTVAAVSDLWG